MSNEPPKQVALPPGVYTIRETTGSNAGKAVTCPANNNDQFKLETYSANDVNQQFVIDAAGLIFASSDRKKLAHSQIPSVLLEPVRRSKSGVAWLITVETVSDNDEAKRGWKGRILSPDENKHYWAPNGQTTGVILRRTAYANWTFRAVTPLVA